MAQTRAEEKYCVVHIPDKKTEGWSLQRFGLNGPSGYLGELLVTQVMANKIVRQLNLPSKVTRQS